MGIMEAKPSLFSINPLEAQVILAYGIFNLLIGPVLGAIHTRSIVILPYSVWGMVFVILGAWMIGGLVFNNWNMLKKSLLVGVTVKMMWLIGLLFVGSWSLVVLWSIFAWIQILCYVYFPRNGYANQ